MRRNWDRKRVWGTVGTLLLPAHEDKEEQGRRERKRTLVRHAGREGEEGGLAEDERCPRMRPAPAGRRLPPAPSLHPVCHLMFAVKYLQTCSHGN